MESYLESSKELKLVICSRISAAPGAEKLVVFYYSGVAFIGEAQLN